MRLSQKLSLLDLPLNPPRGTCLYSALFYTPPAGQGVRKELLRHPHFFLDIQAPGNLAVMLSFLVIAVCISLETMAQTLKNPLGATTISGVKPSSFRILTCDISIFFRPETSCNKKIDIYLSCNRGSNFILRLLVSHRTHIYLCF